MLESYFPVLLLFLVAVIFPTLLLLVTSLLGPKAKITEKMEPYECGVPPVGTLGDRFPVKFYRTAILFLIFDVEAAFLFPWAIAFRHKVPEWGVPFLFAEMGIFLIILVGGYAYAWRRKALEWD